MNCPKCKNLSLRKKEYDSPFFCHKCGGMWLEYDKIKNFVSNSQPSQSDPVEPSSNDLKTGLCPMGHGILIRTKIEIEEPFYLEKCNTCGGIWFDKGEWQKIIDLTLTENLNELWCKSWQIKQRKEKSRESYLETNRQLLGEEIFQDIIRLSEILTEHPEKGRAIALLQQEVYK